jgi:hypothetical protein
VPRIDPSADGPESSRRLLECFCCISRDRSRYRKVDRKVICNSAGPFRLLSDFEENVPTLVSFCWADTMDSCLLRNVFCPAPAAKNIPPKHLPSVVFRQFSTLTITSNEGHSGTFLVIGPLEPFKSKTSVVVFATRQILP